MPWSTEGKHLWTREDEIAAYALYCITPDDKLNASNTWLKRIAESRDISVGSMLFKLQNIKYLYTNDLCQLYAIGPNQPIGRANVSKQNRRIYAEFKNNWPELSREAERITGLNIFRRPPVHGVFINGKPVKAP